MALLEKCLKVFFEYEECVDGEWGSCRSASQLFKTNDLVVSKDLYEEIKAKIGEESFETILNKVR